MLTIKNLEKSENRCKFELSENGNKGIAAGYIEDKIFYLEKLECEKIYSAFLVRTCFHWAVERFCEKIVLKIEDEKIEEIKEINLAKITNKTIDKPEDMFKNNKCCED